MRVPAALELNLIESSWSQRRRNEAESVGTNDSPSSLLQVRSSCKAARPDGTSSMPTVIAFATIDTGSWMITKEVSDGWKRRFGCVD